MKEKLKVIPPYQIVVVRTYILNFLTQCPPPLRIWQIKKEVLSFLYNKNLKVKEEWTIVNSLHLTHPVHNSKRVSKFGHFPLFKFSLLHDLNHIANNSGPMVDVQTLKFKAIVLVRSFSTPLVWQPKEFVISSSDEFARGVSCKFLGFLDPNGM